MILLVVEGYVVGSPRFEYPLIHLLTHLTQAVTNTTIYRTSVRIHVGAGGLKRAPGGLLLSTHECAAAASIQAAIHIAGYSVLMTKL